MPWLVRCSQHLKSRQPVGAPNVSLRTQGENRLNLTVPVRASLEHVLGDLGAADVDVVAGVLDLAHALPQHLHLPLQLEALAEVVAGEHDEPAVDLVLWQSFFQRIFSELAPLALL